MYMKRLCPAVEYYSIFSLCTTNPVCQLKNSQPTLWASDDLAPRLRLERRRVCSAPTLGFGFRVHLLSLIIKNKTYKVRLVRRHLPRNASPVSV